MDKETFLKTKRNFQENYFNYIKPRLDAFEIKRKKYLKIARIVAFVASTSAVLYFFFYSKLGHDACNLNIVITLFMIASFSSKYAQWFLNHKVKKAVMPNICKCFEDLSWNNSKFEIQENFEQTGIVENYNISFVDDAFKGKYENIDFEIIKTSLRKDYKNKGKSPLSKLSDENSDIYNASPALYDILGFFAYLAAKTNIGQGSSKRVFDGIILKINSVKNFTSHTLIKPDSMVKMTSVNLQHTELEDVVFEKKYDVFTNDPTDARYLITTALMERINNIDSVFNAKKLSFAFYQNSLYIAIQTSKELFAPCNIKKEINDASGFVDLFQEIISIYRLIEHLKLS